MECSLSELDDDKDLEGFDDEEMEAQREQMMKEIKAYEAELQTWRTEAKPKHTVISASLIAKKCLTPQQLSRLTDEERIDAILKVTHLQLDDCNIHEIDGLECMTNVTHAYLQHNCITKIQELHWLQNLTVLVLSCNQIKVVENLLDLPELRVLDLSHNLISEVEVKEIPPTVRYLALDGNPCSEHSDYRETLIVHLPMLLEVDGLEVTAEERRLLAAPVNPVLEQRTNDDEDEEDNPLLDDAEIKAEIEAAKKRMLQATAAFEKNFETEGAFRGEVVRDQLMEDYQRDVLQRRELLSQVLEGEIDGEEGKKIDELIASERARREARKKQSSLLGSSCDTDAQDAIQEGLTVALGHQRSAAVSSLDKEVDAARSQMSVKREEMKQRSRARREEHRQGDSEAFTKAKGRLEKQ